MAQNRKEEEEEEDINPLLADDHEYLCAFHGVVATLEGKRQGQKQEHKYQLVKFERKQGELCK